jgi:hypothetical protein
MNQIAMPKAAITSISDMLDNCAKMQPGMEVLILANIDGLNMGENWCDEQAVSWIQNMVQAKGGNGTIMWIDEPGKLHKWRIPPIVKNAMRGADLMINFPMDIVTEEIAEFRNYIAEVKVRMVRNFAVTSTLLCSEWAQTPHELVSAIRYHSSRPFTHMAPFKLTDPNGTHLEGFILDPVQRPGIPGMPYNSTRDECGYYLPWPEWVHPPINLKDVNGEFVFSAMLSWWTRYIGLPPTWTNPVRMTVKDSRIAKIEGGHEADLIRAFLKDMVNRAGDGMNKFDTLHFGIHPNATTPEYQCPNILHKRIIDHSHTSNIHVHIGSAPSSEKYAYYPHITGDIRNATWKVGETLVYDAGYLMVLDDPAVKAVAAKYPDRPGIQVRI